MPQPAETSQMDRTACGGTRESETVALSMDEYDARPQKCKRFHFCPLDRTGGGGVTEGKRAGGTSLL
jgi:hypothetical protein